MWVRGVLDWRRESILAIDLISTCHVWVCETMAGRVAVSRRRDNEGAGTRCLEYIVSESG